MSLLALALTGCTLTSTAPPTPTTGAAIQGRVHGGQQPVSGAQVYLYAANTTGYGGNGIAASTANASISLLTSSVLANNPLRSGIDTSGHYYVTTDATGSFSITGDYNCTPGQQVYLYAVGGNPGSGTNSAAGFLAILGNCPTAGNFAAATPYIWMNEISTIAAAYAFAGFATDATHVSSSGTTLAQTGIANAFLNATNLANLSTGTALATTPAGNGTVPQATINTLANILASCINSTGPISSTCSTLFTNAESAGASGTKATDTATAAINIAHNPGTSIANLYGLQTGIASPFSPALSSQPNDLTLALQLAGGGISAPTSIAVDALGDAWIANDYSSSLSKLSSTGAALSPSSGFPPSGPGGTPTVAIDQTGNAWMAGYNGIISKTSSSGTAISPTGGYYINGGFGALNQLAIDSNGDVWITAGCMTGVGCTLQEFSNAGVQISPTPGYTFAASLGRPYGIAINPNSSVWVSTGQVGGNLLEFSSLGVQQSSTSYTGGSSTSETVIDGVGNIWVSHYNAVSKFSNSGANLLTTVSCSNSVAAISIDGSGNVWALGGQFGLCELTSSGIQISPSSGYTGGTPAIYNAFAGMAIDGSGNVWTAGQYGDNSYDAATAVTEFIGIASPVVTPLATGVKNNTLGTRP